MWTYTGKWSTRAAPRPDTFSFLSSSREYRGTSRGFATRNSRANGASDPYGVLGLQQGASKAEVKRAYLAKAKELHPDVNPDQGAQQRFAEVGGLLFLYAISLGWLTEYEAAPSDSVD